MQFYQLMSYLTMVNKELDKPHDRWRPVASVKEKKYKVRSTLKKKRHRKQQKRFK